MRIYDPSPIFPRPRKGPQRLDAAEIAAMYQTPTPDRQKPWSVRFGETKHQLHFSGKETIEQLAAIVNVALGIHCDKGVMLYASGKRLFSDPEAYHASNEPYPVELVTSLSEVDPGHEIFAFPAER